MAAGLPDITLGIEEEYLLVDPETRGLATRQPSAFMTRCKDLLGDKVTYEFLQSQVEIGTGVCRNIAEARKEIIELRDCISATAREYGMEIIAASTHPWTHWHEQEPVDVERYRILNAEHKSLARRLSICGMHVHAGVADKNQRVDLMGQVTYFMPHLLALTTSSPFWEGRDTGLKSFRPTIMGDLPRSGLPESFDSWNDWEELLDDLATTGMLKDPTRIWWDVRPSNRHPTLELRICDICTVMEDCITIAALYQSIIAFLMDIRRKNLRWRQYRSLLIGENKWRAQRYGIEAELGDFGERCTKPFSELLEELIAVVSPYADDLGCLPEVTNARNIVTRGTSADTQLRIFNEAVEAGATEREAQIKVVDWLVKQTVAHEKTVPA